MMLEGKTALVVGGGRGIGAATAQILAREGAVVAASYLRDRDAAEALAERVRRRGGTIELFQSDAHDPQQLRDLVERGNALRGRLDIVVHSAPAQGVMRPLSTLSWEEFILPVESKLRAAYEIARAAVPLMRKGRSGRLVFVSSGWAKQPSMAGLCGLASAFGAEVSFVRALSREVGPDGITVNAVAPGMVETSLSAQMGPQVRERIVAMTPLGRIATPEDIAGVIAFLASDESGFMTGSYLPVSGGMATD